MMLVCSDEKIYRAAFMHRHRHIYVIISLEAASKIFGIPKLSDVTRNSAANSSVLHQLADWKVEEHVGLCLYHTGK